MNTARIPKEIVTSRMEETRERGRASEKQIDEVEEDLKVMGIRMWQRNGQRPKRMGEECIGRQGPHRTALLQKKTHRRTASEEDPQA
jgi:hypothetical protein